MTKSDLQKLAEMRIREAGILLNAGELDGAYYIGGYAVECALKACIIKRLADYWPDDKNFFNKCYSHELNDLLQLANLQTEINAVQEVAKNWGIVKDWSEKRRYRHGAPPVAVTDFYNAITDPTDGVFQWLKACW